MQRFKCPCDPETCVVEDKKLLVGSLEAKRSGGRSQTESDSIDYAAKDTNVLKNLARTGRPGHPHRARPGRKVCRRVSGGWSEVTTSNHLVSHHLQGRALGLGALQARWQAMAVKWAC